MMTEVGPEGPASYLSKCRWLGQSRQPDRYGRAAPQIKCKKFDMVWRAMSICPGAARWPCGPWLCLRRWH